MALSADLHRALFDELEKISTAELKPKTPRWKRVLKAGALSAAGGTAGYGAGMLVDEGIRRAVGKNYKKWSGATKLRVLPVLSGALGIGAMAAQQYAAHKYQRMVDGQDE